MQTHCPGWPAPHVPPVILHAGAGPVSHGICAACQQVFAITQEPPSTPRLARFVARLDTDRHSPAMMEKLR
jgi:hypothetical protein